MKSMFYLFAPSVAACIAWMMGGKKMESHLALQPCHHCRRNSSENLFCHFGN